jgi:hypothetical protein
MVDKRMYQTGEKYSVAIKFEGGDRHANRRPFYLPP